jgi:hypothetical protein
MEIAIFRVCSFCGPYLGHYTNCVTLQQAAHCSLLFKFDVIQGPHISVAPVEVITWFLIIFKVCHMEMDSFVLQTYVTFNEHDSFCILKFC